MRNTIVRIAILAMAILLNGCNRGSWAEAAAITQLLMKNFDEPEAPLVVGPIAVEGDAALADWTQGALGGRALLRSRGSEWSIVLCAGDGIKSAQALLLTGLPGEQAEQPAAQLTEKERDISPERLATLGTLKGIVRLDHADNPTAHAGLSAMNHSSIAHLSATAEGAVTQTLASGGQHLMIEELQRELLDGEQIPVTLTFDSAASQTVHFTVRTRSL